ncbi:PWWP domain [Spatholobus suberectus]|nr:PWWP domain [Spatholobus suberectus]
MTKKRTTPENKNNNKRKTKMIIPMPKHSQQPRSSPPKRRTDFSVFTRTPSSFSSPASGSSPGSSSGEVRLSNVTASSLQEGRMPMKQFSEDMLVRCSIYQEGRPVCSSEFFDAPVVEVDSAVRDESLNLGGNSRDACNERIDISKMSESTPLESSVSESSSVAVTPGSVVWARTACQMWWPAEVMEETPALSNPGSDGHVLVQFYGNLPSTRIDPMTDISNFEDSFEERSNNPSEDFQQALKQALQRKAQLSSCQKLTPDRSAHSDQQEHSFDKCTSTSTSRTIDDFQERRRGKRERKPKVHFDEVTYPMKSDRKVRRLKIMRYLGLAAPIGSPF